jgi:hypothetical protein
MSMEKYGGMISTRKTDSSHRALWQSNQQRNLVAMQGEVAKEIMSLALRSIFVHNSKGSLTCCKILRHCADGLTCPPKKACCGFLLPLIKVCRPRSGLISEPWIQWQACYSLHNRGRIIIKLLIIQFFLPHLLFLRSKCYSYYANLLKDTECEMFFS